MTNELIKICASCKSEFKDPHDLFKTCELCREKSYEYRQDALREMYEDNE